MIESLIVVGLVTLFCVAGWATMASAESLLQVGIGLAAIGFAYGIPTAIVYHWRLYRSLSRAGRLPPRWWHQPTALHDRIPGADRAGVLFWGAIGGSGFLVIVLGIVLTAAGVWRTLAA